MTQEGFWFIVGGFALLASSLAYWIDCDREYGLPDLGLWFAVSVMLGAVGIVLILGSLGSGLNAYASKLPTVSQELKK